MGAQVGTVRRFWSPKCAGVRVEPTSHILKGFRMKLVKNKYGEYVPVESLSLEKPVKPSKSEEVAVEKKAAVKADLGKSGKSSK